MKDRFAAFLVKNNRLILIIFILLALASSALIPFVNINKDMTKYLPADSDMRRGLDLMEAEFGKEESSTLMVMFDDLTTDAQRLAVRDEMKSLPSVDSVDYELPGSKNGDDYNRDPYSLFVINSDAGQYSDEAATLWKEVNDRYGEDHQIALGGTIDSANHSGLPIWIALCAVGLVFLVLLIMANSWVEPIAFLVTIGVAVGINMGTYIFFPSVSNTTFGIVAILQLALSMDYSIMLLNRYRQQRQVCPDKHEAMRSALGLSFGAITGSSLTTFAGLLALLFMSFGIGADIGLALAKGVLISLLCIFTVLPAMLLALDSLMYRTAKRTLPFDLPRLAGAQFRARLPLTLFFAALLIAGFIARSGVDYTYAQYGSGDTIAQVFGHDNTIVMMYSEKDSEEAGKLADQLEDRDEIRSAVCYESTLGKKRTAHDMKDFIDDMAEEDDSGLGGGDSGGSGDGETGGSGAADLTDSMVRLIYYDYFAGDPDFGMSANEFVSFLQDEVFDDPDFGDSIDPEARDQIDDMARFTDAAALTRQMSAASLADFFGMERDQARQLLLYYQIKKGSADAGRMSLPGFISFLIDDVAADPDYGSMISSSQLKQLRSMRIYTKKKKMTARRPYTSAAKILSMDEDQMRLIYVYYHMTRSKPGKRTISDLALILQDMAADPVLADHFGTPEMAQLIGGLSQVGAMDPTVYPVTRLPQVLAGYGIPLDEQTLTLVDAYGRISMEPKKHLTSVRNIVHFMLADKTIRKTLSKSQRRQLKTLRKIIDTSVSGKRLSPSAMGRLLGMASSDARSVYLLYQYRHGRDGWTLSPQQFINFLVDQVLSDSKMKKQVGSNADDLRLAQRLINGSVRGTSYTYQELADLLGDRSETMTPGDLQMLYELYGSRHRYDDSWRMDLTTMVTHLDDSMIDRPAFAREMSEDQIDDVHDMRADLDEAAEKLKGGHYGRMMITADLEEDSDETRAFMDQLTGYTDSRFGQPVYLIGSTPMAYETSKTFHSELNRVTLLTALFILIIVLATFRRLTISVCLVLIIQCAVFLTMTVLNLFHIDMNYLALLIVQSLMMGATIDYAIIYSTYYIEHRASLPRAESIRASFRGSLQTILTSATILIAAVGLLSFAFAEPATRQICRILSLGCLMATILVIFLLPAILACLDRWIIKRSS